MIFFDIDGTLVDHRRAEQAAALAFHRDHSTVFPEPPDDFSAHWHAVAEKHIHRHLAGEISFQGQRRARLQELFAHQRQLTDEEADDLFSGYLRRYEESWDLYPDVRPCLARLSRQKLGVISNGDSSQQRRKLRLSGIANVFSTVVISGDLGVAKPDAGIFTAACEAASRNPDECVYVGDDQKSDVEGSMQAGLHAVRLNRDGTTVETGFVTIASLEELDKVVVLHNNEVHTISESPTKTDFRNE